MALTAIVLTASNLRAAVTALAPLVSEIREDLSVGASLFGVLGMIPTAMFATAAFVLPGLKARLSTSQLLILAMALTAAGQTIRVLGGPITLLTGSVLALFAIGITNALMPLAVREYFPNRVAAMSTTYLIIAQITQSIAPILVVPISTWASVVGITGWRVSLGSWALLGLVAAISWVPLLASTIPRAEVRTPQPSMAIPVWRTPVGVGLGLMFGFTSFTTYSLMTFLPQMVPDASLGAALLGWWSILGIPLNIIGPWVAARMNNCYPVLVLASGVFLVGNAGLCFAPMAAPWLWTTLSGLGPLAFPIALTLINVRARTTGGATALSSFGQGLAYTVACMGPLLTGVILDTTGGFTVVFGIFLAATVVVLGGGFFATRQVYVEDQARN
ncbi:putative transporter YycB [Corynebacterium faecale]|uniref:MFS transporter n=1 Tax=Corynebacterium faecale TaxID=1758466 RepID=UPI0025B4F561|nr:MFS transporter [Corynebacterium faecale]WJY91605.1 putative transporter YycB [Corynebacterium faecale]